MAVDMSYLNEDSSHQAGGADAYPAVADSNPWGAGGVPSGPVNAYGREATTEGGFYDQRDDLVGGTDTEWNSQASDVSQQSGANWASYGDVAPVFNSSSGLGGERARFTDTLSQGSLAGGSNPDSSFGH